MKNNTRNSKNQPKVVNIDPNVFIENAGVIIDQHITNTLEKNYMPYAMSVIVSRAIPEIDGFKPSHRKLLYTMYKMGLLNGARTKSANVVGQTMKLNPHGDAAIYETMVRLSRGYEVLLHPYIDSKGNFGKYYSRDMAYAASRYTEVKLSNICEELFKDIDKNTTDFTDNYDNTIKEPKLLPVSFPSVLVNANIGIAVGMASCISSFNLAEVCNTTIELIKNPNHDIISTMQAPDFSSGGYILYNKDEMKNIYEAGRGSFKIRSRLMYDKNNNRIEVTQIPPTTTVEAIIDKIIDTVKSGKIKEIADIRDETDLKGLRLAIDLKRGANSEKIIEKLYRFTPLEDTFSCNFNILINGVPKVLGAKDILNEWIKYREKCVERRIIFDISKKKDRLHLLEGLAKILLDIDNAIKIIRGTKSDQEVIPNLMTGFGIDKIQAEFIADIKLRNLNEEYILSKTKEIDILKEQILSMEDIISNSRKIQKVIVKELQEIIKKFGQKRKTELLTNYSIYNYENENTVEDYPVKLFFTKEGYFKKITIQSLRMVSDHKLKQGDQILQTVDASNSDNLLFFTDKHQVYKCRVSDFEDTKASSMGEYVAAKLSMDSGENVIYMVCLSGYVGYMGFFFANGKVSKIDIKSYETKTNRKKLIAAYSDQSPLIAIYYLPKDTSYIVKTEKGRALILNTSLINPKTTKNSIGVGVVTLKKGDAVSKVSPFNYEASTLSDPLVKKMLIKSIPSPGVPMKNKIEQLTF